MGGVVNIKCAEEFWLSAGAFTGNAIGTEVLEGSRSDLFVDGVLPGLVELHDSNETDQTDDTACSKEIGI